MLLALIVAASPATPPETAVQAARTALMPFKKQLKETLLAELAKSPEGAIDVCSVKAPELASTASSPQVTVGRASPKLRNPANVAPAWLTPVMAELAKEKSGAETSRAVVLPNGNVGYAEPIWVQPPCLTCHGKSVAPALEAKLKAKYPTDAARGYELGDFRGVFWAEVQK